MPFYGRPSRSCQSCRERRIKCDRIEPICSQCQRVGKACGGYRDVPSLMFRDENDKTARRSAAAKSRSEARRRLLDSKKPSSTPEICEPSRESRESSVVSERQPLVFRPTISAAVSSTVEEQGLSFFFLRFVTTVPRLEHAPLEVEISPLLGSVLLHAPVRDAAISVGLAARSNVTRDRSLRLVAKEKYAAAISSVRVAVENPQQANPDQTLKLIIMLGLYEMVNCSSKQPDSWTVHVDGAAALMKQLTFDQALKALRPRPQLQYYYVSIVKYFIADGNAAPNLPEWAPEVMSSFGLDEQPAVCLINIMFRFTRLHFSIRSNADIDPRTAIQLVRSIESELDLWERTLPSRWAFVMKDSSDTQNTFNGRYMVYDNEWAARDLNHYFWTRLMVNETILMHTSRLPMMDREDVRQRQLALETIAQMGVYICAGAASQMGAHGCGLPGGGTTRMPPLNGVFMLMFPLAVAGGAGGSPDNVYQWVVQRLQIIGSTMGIQRALELIPRVKMSRERRQHQVQYNINVM